MKLKILKKCIQNESSSIIYEAEREMKVKFTTRNCFMFPPQATSCKNLKPWFTSDPIALPMLTNTSSGKTTRGTLDGDLSRTKGYYSRNQ